MTKEIIIAEVESFVPSSNMNLVEYASLESFLLGHNPEVIIFFHKRDRMFFYITKSFVLSINNKSIQELKKALHSSGHRKIKFI